MPVTSKKNKAPVKKSANQILSVDIGGSHIKATVLDGNGVMVEPYKKLPTPNPASPDAVVAVIKKLASLFSSFDKISVGFPGYVKEGVVYTAPNLGEGWHKTDLARKLAAFFKVPVRIVNDADMQGLALAKGKGFEIVVTLGTGFGTAFLLDGKLLPHIELAHHPLSGKKDYDVYIGEKALKKIGKKEWNKRMKRVIGILKTVFNYDHLHIGGGNASVLNFPLDDNISIVSNKEGIRGGAVLWQKAFHL